jgi:hypothetical protein
MAACWTAYVFNTYRKLRRLELDGEAESGAGAMPPAASKTAAE